MASDGEPRPSDLLSINSDRVYYFFVARHCWMEENQSDRFCGNSAMSEARLPCVISEEAA